MNSRTLRYIIRFLLGDDVSEDVVSSIGYTANPKLFERYSIVILPSGFFSNHVYGTPASLPELPLKEIEGTPLLFGTPEVEQVDDTLVIHADLIASTYFLVTRYEEVVRRNVRDEHGRFPGKESLPYRAGFIHRPIVDEYRQILRRWLRDYGFPIPEDKAGLRRIWLTHDLDAPTLYRSWRGVVRSIRDHRGILPSFRGKFGALESDPYYTFPWMFERDKAFRQEMGGDVCRSVLFVRSGGRCRQDKPHYSLRDKDINHLLSYAAESDIAVGLHASYEAGRKPHLVKTEKAALETHLGKRVRMNRHHYLSLREPEDMMQLEAVGVTDDFTMGYADVAGFRLGTSRPIHWIDPVNHRLSSVVMHPLTVMDCTLEEKKYMGLGYEEALAYSLRLAEEAKKAGGELTLLWHNSSCRDGSDSYLKRLYGCLLNELAKK